MALWNYKVKRVHKCLKTRVPYKPGTNLVHTRALTSIKQAPEGQKSWEKAPSGLYSHTETEKENRQELYFRLQR